MLSERWLPLFEWAGKTWLGTAVRDNVLAFPVIETFHLLALAVLLGTVGRPLQQDKPLRLLESCAAWGGVRARLGGDTVKLEQLQTSLNPQPRLRSRKHADTLHAATRGFTAG